MYATIRAISAKPHEEVCHPACPAPMAGTAGVLYDSKKTMLAMLSGFVDREIPAG